MLLIVKDVKNSIKNSNNIFCGITHNNCEKEAYCMEETRNSPLAELLSRDSDSREFFAGLSPELRKGLMRQDTDTFETLKSCAENYKKDGFSSSEESYDYYNPACSAHDCTGLIPSGSDKKREHFDDYKQLYPFGVPPCSD